MLSTYIGWGSFREKKSQQVFQQREFNVGNLLIKGWRTEKEQGNIKRNHYKKLKGGEIKRRG